MENPTNQNQQPQSVDVVGIVARAMYQCQGEITKVIEFMFREHERLIIELKKSQEFIVALNKEIEDLKKPKD